MKYIYGYCFMGFNLEISPIFVKFPILRAFNKFQEMFLMSEIYRDTLIFCVLLNSSKLCLHQYMVLSRY